MDQPNPLADTFSRVPALVNGLLSGSGGDTTAPDDLFSALLSQSDSSPSLLTGQNSFPPVAAQPALSSPPPVSSNIRDAVSPPAVADKSVHTGSGNASDPSLPMIHKLADILSSLHKILHMLHQKNNGNSSDQKTTASLPGNPSDQTGEAPQTTTPTTTDQAATDHQVPNTPATGKIISTLATTDTKSSDVTTQVADTTGDKKAIPTLADILAELLAITPMLIFNLQKIETTGGMHASGSVTVIDDKGLGVTSALTALAADIADNADLSNGTKGGDLLTLKDILTLKTDTDNGMTNNLIADLVAIQNNVPNDSLLDVLKSVEKDVQKLLPLLAGTTASAVTPPATSTAVAPDLLTHLTALDASLKNSIKAWSQHNQMGTNAGAHSVSALMPQTEIAAATKIIATIKPDLTVDQDDHAALPNFVTEATNPTPTIDKDAPASQVAFIAAATKPSLINNQDSRILPSAPVVSPIKPSLIKNQDDRILIPVPVAATDNPAPALAPSDESSPQTTHTENVFLMTDGGKQSESNRQNGSQSFTHDSRVVLQTPVNEAPNGSGAMPLGATVSGTYSFAGTLSAARATGSNAAAMQSAVDQVILQMNRSVKNGNDQMSLQLHPADMGKITVKLDFGSDGKVQGVVTADNPKTLDWLQKDSRSLERALQDAGLRADPGSLHFNLSDHHQNAHQGNGSGQGHAANTGAQNAANQTDGGLSENLMGVGLTTETYYITPDAVNIMA